MTLGSRPATQQVAVDDAAAKGSWHVVVVAVVILAIAFGAFVRLWVLFHQPISSDEANAGMLAEQILRGHFQAFYPGQVYGGAEFYVLAVVIAIGGHTSFTLHLEPILFSVAAAVLLWRVTVRLVRSRWLAALTGAVVFAAPEVNIATSSVYQGRGLTLVCGLLCTLYGLRLLDEPRSMQSRKGLIDCGVLGLAAGLGWWSMPEFGYFLPAAVLLAIAAFVVRREGVFIRERLVRVGLVVAMFVLGALPWIWSNLKSNFASLHVSSFTGAQGGLWAQLSSHFHPFMLYVLPMQLGLREQETGSWFGGAAISWIVAVLAFSLVAWGLLVCIWKRGRSKAIAVGVLCFPVLYSTNPGTWFWQDGRYAVYLFSLLALPVAIGLDELAFWLRARSWSRLLHRGEAAMSLAVVVSLALASIAFGDATGVRVTSIARGWGSPDSRTEAAIDSLESAGITYGYADYWVAYKLDYLSDGRLVIDTSGIGDDLDRWPAIDATVLKVKRPAWLFVRPAPITAESPFDVTGGPNGETESVFLAGLKQRHIKYRIVDAGPLQAVVARQVVEPRTYAGPLAIGG
jgi:hypothetical protein